jgi:membrane fusion protein (multidrug efflux system)
VPQGSSNFVWLVDQSVTPNTVRQVQVTVGARQPGTIEVLSGLNAGDMVVSHGVQKMRPGANVAVIGIDDGTRSIAAMLKQAATAEPGD